MHVARDDINQYFTKNLYVITHFQIIELTIR